MSEEGRAVVPIPGGAKLLANVTTTGQMLMDDYALIQEWGDVASREDLLEILEGHAKIGEVMVAAMERTQRAMEAIERSKT